MGAWGLLGVSLALPSGVTHFHWDWAYVWKALPSLLKMIPVTLELAICGFFRYADRTFDRADEDQPLLVCSNIWAHCILGYSAVHRFW